MHTSKCPRLFGYKASSKIRWRPKCVWNHIPRKAHMCSSLSHPHSSCSSITWEAWTNQQREPCSASKPPTTTNSATITRNALELQGSPQSPNWKLRHCSPLPATISFVWFPCCCFYIERKGWKPSVPGLPDR